MNGIYLNRDALEVLASLSFLVAAVAFLALRRLK